LLTKFAVTPPLPLQHLPGRENRADEGAQKIVDQVFDEIGDVRRKVPAAPKIEHEFISFPGDADDGSDADGIRDGDPKRKLGRELQLLAIAP